jgi:4-hydroxybenzoate polyprenyltransferase
MKSAYLYLVRPANIVTSASDAIAGIAISGAFSLLFGRDAVLIVELLFDMLALTLASCFFYAGGIAFNDIFDYKLDKKERPERVLPSGQISINNAVIFASILLLLGLILTLYVGLYSGIIGIYLVAAIFLYNTVAKKNNITGPLIMGLCRALNLSLGISIILSSLQYLYYLAFIPWIYIFAITLISRGEVSSLGVKNIYIGLSLYLVVILLLIYVSFEFTHFSFLSLVFIGMFAFNILSTLIPAIRFPNDINAVRNAVKNGVISIILLDACFAIVFSNFMVAILIVSFMPLASYLSKTYQVT